MAHGGVEPEPEALPVFVTHELGSGLVLALGAVASCVVWASSFACQVRSNGSFEVLPSLGGSAASGELRPRTIASAKPSLHVPGEAERLTE